jgi:hypothetical protein
MNQHSYQEHKDRQSYTNGHHAQMQEPVQENNMNDTLQVPPQTLSEAIKELPRQYINIFIKPSVEKFTQEMGKARWSMVGVQLFLCFGVVFIFALLASLQPALYDIFGANTILGLNMPLSLTLGSLFEFIATTGVLYILAKMFKGQGTILTQTYIALMLSVPLELLNLVGLAFYPIPFAGVALFYIWIFAWSIYSIVLMIYALMAVHRLSGGKATGVFFIDLLLIVAVSSIFSIITTHLH